MWQQQMRIVNLNDGSNLIPNCQIEVIFLKSKISKSFFLVDKRQKCPQKERI